MRVEVRTEVEGLGPLRTPTNDHFQYQHGVEVGGKIHQAEIQPPSPDGTHWEVSLSAISSSGSVGCRGSGVLKCRVVRGFQIFAGVKPPQFARTGEVV
jgi:hypothetical protein